MMSEIRNLRVVEELGKNYTDNFNSLFVVLIIELREH